MRAQRKSTTVYSFLRRARQQYPTLGLKDDEAFLQQAMGCGKHQIKSWYSKGIKPVYLKTLAYIEENQQLRQENQQLKQELKQKIN